MYVYVHSASQNFLILIISLIYRIFNNYFDVSWKSLYLHMLSEFYDIGCLIL